MKNLLHGASVIALSALLVGCSSSSEAATSSSSNTYTGSAEGKNGTVTVEVVYEDDTIKSVTVTEQEETEGIADPALEQIPEAIVEANSTDVEAVSGATVTSEAIKEAVNAALESAK